MKKLPKCSSVLIALLSLWSTNAALAQDLSTVSNSGATVPKIPLTAVTVGKALTSTDILDAAALGLGSPALRGEEIERELGIVRLPPKFAPADWKKTFEEAEAAFFNGDLDNARSLFEKISDFIEENPSIPAFYPRFRTILFKSRIHLSVIAHNAGDTKMFDRRLREAAEIEDTAPSPEDFPPWVCSAFAAAEKSLARTATGNLRLKKQKECSLSVLGRPLGKGPLFKNLPVGETFVRVRCGDKVSPVQKIEIKQDRTVDFVPVMLAAEFDRRGSDAVLKVPAEIEEARVIEDLSALGAALRKDRAAAVILKPDETAVVLVDTGLGREIRRATQRGAATPKGVENAARSIAASDGKNDLLSAAALGFPEPSPKRKWYKDWVAWTLSISGAAAISAGVGLLCAYDMESEQSPIGVGLASGGGGLLAAGAVLFVVQPLVLKEQNGVSTATFGATVGGTF